MGWMERSRSGIGKRFNHGTKRMSLTYRGCTVVDRGETCPLEGIETTFLLFSDRAWSDRYRPPSKLFGLQEQTPWSPVKFNDRTRNLNISSYGSVSFPTNWLRIFIDRGYSNEAILTDRFESKKKNTRIRRRRIISMKREASERTYVISIEGAWSAMYSMSLSPSLLALLLISVAFGAADGFGISEIKIFFKDRLSYSNLFDPFSIIDSSYECYETTNFDSRIMIYKTYD